MSKLASASINNLPSIATQADFVPTSEQLITLTIGQLQELICQAVQKAIQPLQDEITALRTERDQDRGDFERFKATHRTFAVQTGKDIDALFEANLKATARPQPLQKDRADILRALLAANNGKMLAKDARQKMHLSRSAFSQLIATMKDNIEVKPFHIRKNQNVLILKSCLAKQ